MSDDLLSKSAVERHLQTWSLSRGTGSVLGVTRLNGHSGVSYRFIAGNGLAMVVRLAPPGVTGVEGADVLRQVPVLQAARAAGVPVPAVIDHGTSDSVFGTDYMVVEFIAGTLVGDIFEHWRPPSSMDLAGVTIDAASSLAKIHAVDWTQDLAGWDNPRTLTGMIEHLDPAIARAEDPTWLDLGKRLRDALVANMPSSPAVGLVHNDFYSNNWITDGASRVRAVLDWETACIGPTAADVGWFMMMHDQACWSASTRHHMADFPSDELVLDAYVSARQEAVDDVEWFRAFACYRLISGVSFYLRLHRRGRRIDDVWETFAHSVPHLAARGLEVLV